MSSPEPSFIPPPPTPAPTPEQPAVLQSSRFGQMEEHELIRLLDSINDERARARFRESIYISMFVWIAVAWFLFYGPQVLFHAPRLVDPSTMLRHQHDMEIAQLSLPPSLRRNAPRPRPPAKPSPVDSKLLEKLRAAEPKPAPAPLPPPPAPTTEATVLPPVPPAPTPPPAPPRAVQPTPIPEAPTPHPAVNFNTPSTAGDAVRNAANAATRGGFSGTTTTPSRRGRPGLGAGLRVVSDTQGVNFDDYLRRLHDIIQNSWEPLLPESVRPPISTRGITGIDFKIAPNGDLAGITIISASGTTSLDRAAWDGITSSGKFPPLPKEYHGALELQCGFYVNINPPDE